MAGFDMMIKISFTVLAAIQIVFIIVSMALNLSQSNLLGLLSLIDLCFPPIGIYAVWKYDESQRDPTDPTCLKSFLLLIVYTVWCIIWVIVGIIISIFDDGVVAGLPGQVEPSLLGITGVEIILQAIGFVFGCILLKMSTPHKASSPKSGFV